MGSIMDLLSKAEGNKQYHEKWYLMFTACGSDFNGSVYIAKRIDLNNVYNSAKIHTDEMQDRLRKEVNRVHEAWNRGVDDPGCCIDFQAVFLGNTNDDLPEYIPRDISGNTSQYSWQVYSLGDETINKDGYGFAEGLDESIPKMAGDIINKLLRSSKLA